MHEMGVSMAGPPWGAPKTRKRQGAKVGVKGEARPASS